MEAAIWIRACKIKKIFLTSTHSACMVQRRRGGNFKVWIPYAKESSQLMGTKRQNQKLGGSHRFRKSYTRTLRREFLKNCAAITSWGVLRVHITWDRLRGASGNGSALFHFPHSLALSPRSVPTTSWTQFQIHLLSTCPPLWHLNRLSANHMVIVQRSITIQNVKRGKVVCDAGSNYFPTAFNKDRHSRAALSALARKTLLPGPARNTKKPPRTVKLYFFKNFFPHKKTFIAQVGHAQNTTGRSLVRVFFSAQHSTLPQPSRPI